MTNQPFSSYAPQPGTCSPTAVPDLDLPSAFGLALAGRHPAIGAATLELSLPTAGHVSLTVRDVAGRRVAQLVDGEMPAGRHTLRWDRTANGRQIAAGVYFARVVRPDGQSIVRRVVML